MVVNLGAMYLWFQVLVSKSFGMIFRPSYRSVVICLTQAEEEMF